MRCRDCKGTGRVDALVYRETGCTDELITCPRCRGKGEEPNESAEWVRTGKALRKHRIGQYTTQREMAERIDISTAHLSQMENGLRDPTPYVRAYNEGRTCGPREGRE